MQNRLPLAIIEDLPPIREMLHQYPCAQPESAVVTPPALVLSDVLPSRSGIERRPLILARLPEAQVLMLSVFTDAPRVFEAICAGAVGYLVKNTPLPLPKAPLLEVAGGGSPMSPAVARHVLQAFRCPPPVAASAMVGLTAREQAVVTAVEEGLSYKLIADTFRISRETVKNHLRAVCRKLQINSEGELLALALKRRP